MPKTPTANPSPQQSRLQPSSIRSLAQSFQYIHEIAACPTKQVISFLHTTSPSRINVYYHTGTVGTCRVLNNSEVRETFRRKCSLETLEQIFIEPPQPTQIDESLVEGVEGPRKQLELVDVGIALLQAEKEKLEDYANSLLKDKTTTKDKNNNNNNNTTTATTTTTTNNTPPTDRNDNSLTRKNSSPSPMGRSFAYSLRDETVTDVERYLDCWNEVRCVATNGQGTIVLYETGGWAFTDGISRFLEKKLNARQGHLAAPEYVAMGSDNQYYVMFEDGTFEWMGCDVMDDLMGGLAEERDVLSVAFGEHWETFFVVYDDGSWEYNGKIPYGLSEKLHAREKRGDLSCVSLGPNGEWFLKAENGRMWWGGLSEDLNKEIEPIADKITFMDFGDDFSYIIRYIE